MVSASEWVNFHYCFVVITCVIADSKALSSAQRQSFYKGIVQVRTPIQSNSIYYIVPIFFTVSEISMRQNQNRIGYVLRVISAEEISKKMLRRLVFKFCLAELFVTKHKNLPAGLPSVLIKYPTMLLLIWFTKRLEQVSTCERLVSGIFACNFPAKSFVFVRYCAQTGFCWHRWNSWVVSSQTNAGIQRTDRICRKFYCHNTWHDKHARCSKTHACNKNTCITYQTTHSSSNQRRSHKILYQVTKKADSLFPCVSAASIVAKVRNSYAKL